MKIFENEFCEMELTEDNLLQVVWFPTTATMKDNDLMTQQLLQKDTVIQNNVKKVLIDGRNQLFTITPELQERIGREALQPAIEAGLQKVAIILPTDIFAMVSIEQTMGEGGAQGFETCYFENEITALACLNC